MCVVKKKKRYQNHLNDGQKIAEENIKKTMRAFKKETETGHLNFHLT